MDVAHLHAIDQEVILNVLDVCHQLPIGTNVLSRLHSIALQSLPSPAHGRHNLSWHGRPNTCLDVCGDMLCMLPGFLSHHASVQQILTSRFCTGALHIAEDLDTFEVSKERIGIRKRLVPHHSWGYWHSDGEGVHGIPQQQHTDGQHPALS